MRSLFQRRPGTAVNFFPFHANGEMPFPSLSIVCDFFLQVSGGDSIHKIFLAQIKNRNFDFVPAFLKNCCGLVGLGFGARSCSATGGPFGGHCRTYNDTQLRKKILVFGGGVSRRAPKSCFRRSRTRGSTGTSVVTALRLHLVGFRRTDRGIHPLTAPSMFPRIKISSKQPRSSAIRVPFCRWAGFANPPRGQHCKTDAFTIEIDETLQNLRVHPRRWRRSGWPAKMMDRRLVLLKPTILRSMRSTTYRLGLPTGTSGDAPNCCRACPASPW